MLPVKNEVNRRPSAFWYVKGPGPSFIDFENDVTVRDLNEKYADLDEITIAQKYLANPNVN